MVPSCNMLGKSRIALEETRRTMTLLFMLVAFLGIISLATCSPVGEPSDGNKIDEPDDDSWPWNLIKDAEFWSNPEAGFKQLDFKLSPVTDTIPQFNVNKINFTAIRLEIDEFLDDFNSRRGKSLDLGSVTQLPKFLSTTLKYVDLKQVVYEVETSLLSSVSCTACKAGVGLLQHYIKTGKTRQEIAHAAIKLCINLKLESKRVCVGIIYLFVDEVLHILERLVLEPEEVCGIIIGDGCSVPYIPWHDWNVTFPPIPKPLDNPSGPKPTQAQASAAAAPGGKATLKVLHLSDNHYDPYYLAGSNAECGEPLCCRATDGLPAQPSAAAGVWGDYRHCDTPRRTIENLYEHIVKTHPDLDYIIWTGDLPPHDVWNQTREDQLHVLRETVDQLARYFPNIPIFPALGNHESTPVNSFPPPQVTIPAFSIQWLYNELDAQWRRWLPEATSQTVRYGAYYSVAVRPGFRIISLNMNYCHNKNWWLLMNTTDPAQELQWLIYELQAAELSGDMVHILGHIPPGHADCLKTWSKNFYKVISRYEKTVAAQFYGHTHFDEFSLFYDEAMPTRAVSIAYIGPSVTPYYDLNPGYRVYTIDGDREGSTRQVLDHENWYMDLKEANLYNRPRWRKLYSALQAYGMKGATPKDWDTLVHKLTYNDNLFQMYYKFYWKASPVRPQCDEECKKRLLCDLVSGRSHDRKQTCVVIEQRMDEQTGGWKTWLVNGLTITFLLVGLYLAMELIAYLRSTQVKHSNRQMNVMASMDTSKWRTSPSENSRTPRNHRNQVNMIL